jgi:hypothetical protein
MDKTSKTLWDLMFSWWWRCWCWSSSWRWRQYVRPKCWYLPTSPHSITTQKTFKLLISRSPTTLKIHFNPRLLSCFVLYIESQLSNVCYMPPLSLQINILIYKTVDKNISWRMLKQIFGLRMYLIFNVYANYYKTDKNISKLVT